MRFRAVCAAAFLLLTVLVAHPASAEQGKERPAGEALAGYAERAGGYRAAETRSGTDPRWDDYAFDPRGDIVSFSVANEPTIVVQVTVAQGEPFSSAGWGSPATLILAGFANSAGDLQHGAFISTRGEGSVHDASGRFVCGASTGVSGNTYRISFDSACIGSPSSIPQAGILMFYDTDPHCVSTPCDGSEITDDFAGPIGPIARGSAAPPPPSPSPTGGTGYWFVAADGGVFTYNRPFFGSAVGRIDSPVVGMAAHPTQGGYWLVNSNGRVYPFGAARHFGDLGGVRLNSPIVDIEVTPSGNGYYLLGRDGGIFTFGDAPFHGSTGNIRLNQPIVGMAVSNR